MARTRPRWTRWWYALAAVLIAAAGALWVKSATGPELGAEETVRAYFAALADRDGEKARSLLARGDGEKVEMVLLGDGTVRDSGYTPPGDLWTRLDYQESPLKAVVQARFKIAGNSHDREFHLTRPRPDTEWRIHQGWSILPARTRTVLPLRVAGTRVGRDPGGYLPAFPGAYRIEVADNDLFTAGPITVVAGLVEAPGLVLRLRPEHHAELDLQIRRYLDGCAERAVPDAPDCPFDPGEGIEYPANFFRRITDYPRLMFQAAADGTVKASGESPGRAEVIGTGPDGAARPIVTETFNLTGSLKLTGKSFTFVPG